MEFVKENLVKSPLNYTGGKFKLLPQILPLFPSNINTFVDLFAGGCNVGVNVKADNIICNDIEFHVINLMKKFEKTSVESILNEIEDNINKFNLSKTSKYGYEYYNTNSSDGVANYNKGNYIKLREFYNENMDNDLLFFTVVIFAFNNQIRFNKNTKKFNVAVNKRDFNDSMKKNIIKFINRLHNVDIKFTSKDFSLFDTESLTTQDLVYCDPPYLITCANYNEHGGWDEIKERELLEFLEVLNKKSIRFALSNVLESKGKSNDILKEWSKKYNIHYLNNTYGNCNYQTKDKSKIGATEVLITNY